MYLLNWFQSKKTISLIKLIKKNQFNQKKSDFSAFSLDNSSLVQYDLLPPIVFVKQRTSNYIYKNDEAIDGIIYNNTLALRTSKDTEKIIRLELRFLVTLERI